MSVAELLARSARLRLYGDLSSSGSVPFQAAALRAGAWSEAAVTWNNKPVPGNQAAATSISSTSPRWYELDVTGYVRAEKSAGRHVPGVALLAGVTTKTREDGLSIDQIVLSPAAYLTRAPGTTKLDATILPKSP